MVENTFTATRSERMGQEVRRWQVVADHVSVSLANQTMTPKRVRAPEAAASSSPS